MSVMIGFIILLIGLISLFGGLCYWLEKDRYIPPLKEVPRERVGLLGPDGLPLPGW